MDSFIVRVYRRMRNGKSMLGVVETTDTLTQEKPFHCADELWKILLSTSQGNKAADKSEVNKTEIEVETNETEN